MAQTTTQKRGGLRTLIGTVISDKAEKTVTVSVDRLVKHPRYGKYIRRRSRLHVHDPKNTTRVGDKVQIAECRPISKTKNWRIFKLLERPDIAEE